MAPIQRCRPSEFDTQSDCGGTWCYHDGRGLALRFEASLMSSGVSPSAPTRAI
jgi:hypothetical protein